MGICMFGSSSSYDKKISKSMFGGSISKSQVYLSDSEKNCRPIKGNPNPKNYVIKEHSQIGEFLIIFINYPDCNNYEGNKILVFRRATRRGLEKQKVIDPHFSENFKYHSPIARFIPTNEGWKMAINFCMFMESKRR